MMTGKRSKESFRLFIENLSKGMPPWEAAKRAGLDPSKAWIYASAAASAGLIGIARVSHVKCRLGACEKCPLRKFCAP
jgi:hypothetical protein